MSDHIEHLEAEYEQAEQTAAEIQARKDALASDALALRDELVAANEKAQAAQKALCDAQAVSALVDRPDAEAFAKALNLTLPKTTDSE